MGWKEKDRQEGKNAVGKNEEDKGMKERKEERKNGRMQIKGKGGRRGGKEGCRRKERCKDR